MPTFTLQSLVGKFLNVSMEYTQYKKGTINWIGDREFFSSNSLGLISKSVGYIVEEIEFTIAAFLCYNLSWGKILRMGPLSWTIAPRILYASFHQQHSCYTFNHSLLVTQNVREQQVNINEIIFTSLMLIWEILCIQVTHRSRYSQTSLFSNFKLFS